MTTGRETEILPTNQDGEVAMPNTVSCVVCREKATAEITFRPNSNSRMELRERWSRLSEQRCPV